MGRSFDQRGYRFGRHILRAKIAFPLGLYQCQSVSYINSHELGLIYTIDIDKENAVEIKMSLTAPGCPVAGEMPGWVADAVEPLAGVKQVNVELVWEPPWGMDMMSDEARLELGFM